MEADHIEKEVVKLRIIGHVQGVAYRYWAEKNAHMLNLDGWVRNRTDGSVEAVFSGKQDDVKEMIQRCHCGPPNAKVENVTIDKKGINGQCHLPDPEFKILPTV